MAQKLYIDNFPEPLNVVRSFSDGNKFVIEFLDGSFGYKNGDKVQSEEEFSFLPENHKIRAIKWLENRKTLTGEKRLLREELERMTVPQLQLITGLKTEDKEALIDRASKIK
jgi:hypothetical protein